MRAAKLAGLTNVPVLIRQVTEQQQLELALIENVQRSDLMPLETATAYQELADTFKLSHEEIATRVGKSRVSVTNTIRLLKLPETIKTALAEGKISEGHARALLALNSPQSQIAALNTILKNSLSVRQTEELVRNLGGKKTPRPTKPSTSPEIKAIEERLRNVLGTKVTLRHGKKRGKPGYSLLLKRRVRSLTGANYKTVKYENSAQRKYLYARPKTRGCRSHCS